MIEFVFLGTSASAPSVDRGLSAAMVMHEDQRFLVDCGEGTQRQILKSGLGFKRLDKVLLTHGHLDHFGGLPDVLQHTKAEVCIHPLDGRLSTANAECATLLRRSVRRLLQQAGAPPDVAAQLLGQHWQQLPGDFPTLQVNVELLEQDEVDGLQVMHTPGHSPGHVDRQALTRLLIHQRQQPQRATVVGPIVNEVVRPDVVPPQRPKTHTRTVVQPQSPTFGLLGRHFQALPPPETLDSLVVHTPSLDSQHCRNPTVTVTAVLPGQLFHSSD